MTQLNLQKFTSKKIDTYGEYTRQLTKMIKRRLKCKKLFFINKRMEQKSYFMKDYFTPKEALNDAYVARKFPSLFVFDIVPLVNALKRRVKFQEIYDEKFINCCIYFKYTGSNIFGTITNRFGEVLFVYSAGIFKDLHTRKEKTTIFVAQQLGELISLRLYKTNAREIYFIPFINHTKARVLLRFLATGFAFIKLFKISKVIIKRKVMRNGVRLAKPARK